MGVRDLIKLNKYNIIQCDKHIKEVKVKLLWQQRGGDWFFLYDSGKLKRRGHFNWVLEDKEEYYRQQRERGRGFHVREIMGYSRGGWE